MVLGLGPIRIRMTVAVGRIQKRLAAVRIQSYRWSLRSLIGTTVVGRSQMTFVELLRSRSIVVGRSLMTFVELIRSRSIVVDRIRMAFVGLGLELIRTQRIAVVRNPIVVVEGQIHS